MLQIEFDQRSQDVVHRQLTIVHRHPASMKAFVTVFLAVLATTCAGHSIPAALFTPYVPVHPLDQGYFPVPRFYHGIDTAVEQEHPVVRFPDVPIVYHHEPTPVVFLPPVHQQPQPLPPQPLPPQPQVTFPGKSYLTYVNSPSASLVAYVPVQRGSQGPWGVPNVFIKGQGYSTNQYVAPAVMKKHLAQDPR